MQGGQAEVSDPDTVAAQDRPLGHHDDGGREARHHIQVSHQPRAVMELAATFTPLPGYYLPLCPSGHEFEDYLALPHVACSDMGGSKEQIDKMREVVELPMLHPEKFVTLGIDPPKGVLMYGPPGTGGLGV